MEKKNWTKDEMQHATKKIGGARGGGKTAAMTKAQQEFMSKQADAPMHSPAIAPGASKPTALRAVVNNSNKTIEVDLERDAKPNCKGCHGTGVVGIRQHKDGKREKIVCACVVKAMKKRASTDKAFADSIKKQLL